ncbi:winged helix-turn-helix transcriptional regulator [Bifidobacterium magnum]
MISQQELAQLCGITRSGVAAHISKLIHKGYVQGKRIRARSARIHGYCGRH